MNEERFEQLLEEVYSGDIAPSEKLVLKTKQSAKRSRLTEYMVALVVTVNLLIFLAFIGYLVLAPYGVIIKVLIYMGATSVYNSLALAGYLRKEQLIEFFERL